MEKENIYILGIGHNSIVTIDLAESCGYHVAGLYHYQEGRTGDEYFGHKIIGTNDELFAQDLTGQKFALSMGDNDIRADLFRRIIEHGGEVPTLLHPTAIVPKYAKIGRGVHLYSSSMIDPDATIGDDCIILPNVHVAHCSKIGNHCFIASGVFFGAYTEMEDFAFIGSGATVISAKAKSLGKHCLVGAGAVVTKPVAENAVVAGNPARVIR